PATASPGRNPRPAPAAPLGPRPRILVLDEPMVGLDPQGAVALRRLLTGLSAEGVTIFLSTHSLGVAEALCDRIGILDHGRLVALGSLADLRRHADAPRAAAPPGAVFLRIPGAAGA